jgi:hypothetical protein
MGIITIRVSGFWGEGQSAAGQYPIFTNLSSISLSSFGGFPGFTATASLFLRAPRSAVIGVTTARYSCSMTSIFFSYSLP